MNHRVFTLLLGATAALATLTACGASNSDTGGSAGNPPAAASGAVSVKDVDGVGQALVDPAGKTLYFADQEAGGSIKCTANCLSFWMSRTSPPGLSCLRRQQAWVFLSVSRTV